MLNQPMAHQNPAGLAGINKPVESSPLSSVIGKASRLVETGTTLDG